MKLIAGLGNPGTQYKGTRHNVGFEVLTRLSARFATTTPRARFQGETAEATIAGEKVLLLTPLTYMNLSGASVLAARDFYKLDNADLLVVCDDFNLPLAKLRLRAKGTAGGQKGLEDVIRRLGTDEVSRLRIGIGVPPPGRDVTGYVLGRFTTEEQTEVVSALDKAADAAAAWVEHGIEQAMNQYNAETKPTDRS
jgi:peptidyl-tRNA hydrolase, PTH1 family